MAWRGQWKCDIDLDELSNGMHKFSWAGNHLLLVLVSDAKDHAHVHLKF